MEPILRFLNRRVARPLDALRTGNPVFRHLKTLEQRQWESADEIRVRTLQSLREIIRHAGETVPFYRKAWSAAGIRGDGLGSIDDLAQFPIITKDDLRRHGPSMRSEATGAVATFDKTTSGSTGVPLTVTIDEPALRWKQAATLRCDQWSGYRLGGRVAKVWGNPEYQKYGLKGRLRNHLIDRAVYLDTLGMDEARIDDFCRQLVRKPPSLLFGHAHSLYLTACYVRRKFPGRIRPDGIISTAMMLHAFQRKVIEDAFGTKVTDRYGSEEVSLIGSECPEHHGLHVNTDSVHVEIVPDPHLIEGGHIVVTDLVNRAMPLIRYRIGDVGVMSGRTCRCGRGMPLLDKVVGREADYVLTPDGRLISGISLTENFAVRIPGTAQIQIVQDARNAIRVRLVPDDRFNDDSRSRIDVLVHETFGKDMRCELELVERIPQEPSGKYRFCVSPVAREYMESLSA